MGASLVAALENLGNDRIQEGMDLLTDTLAMFGYVYWVCLTDKRREFLRAKLLEDCKALVSVRAEPSPTNLLGDVAELQKSISETEKITSLMDKAKARVRYQEKDRESFPARRSYANRRGSFGRKFETQRRAYYTANRMQDHGAMNDRASVPRDFRKGPTRR